MNCLFRLSSRRVLLSIGLAIFASAAFGCRDSAHTVDQVQRRREQERRNVNETDHLGQAFAFLAEYGELIPEEAQRRISSLLNAWLDAHPMAANPQLQEIVQQLPAALQREPSVAKITAGRFSDQDVDYLRLNYLLAQVNQWIDPEVNGDPLFMDWIASKASELGPDARADLEQAVRLFDWTVRNIQLEPFEASGPAPPAPSLPAGLQFRGPGYRQTTFQTLNRGAGDAWQRARIFIQLCRQARIDACMLAAGDGAPGKEWAVAVRIGSELYLFEPLLGLPVPGPDQIGIATLKQARSDTSVMRRLNVLGWFDYPLTSEDIQFNTAYLDAPPESLAARMRHLEDSLVGELRMTLSYDADASAKVFVDHSGIDACRIWPQVVEARIYRQAMEELAKNSRDFATWEAFNWGMLSGVRPLAVARWEHLSGQFEREESKPGARVLYMELRSPEFDIEDLRENPELQNRYGVRRGLGITPEEYDMQIRQVQHFMRNAKRSATYWISLIHYEEADYETAVSWFQKRVLDEDRESEWKPGARYGLARSLERLGNTQQAVELYKTIGDPQEFGNRLRARLLQRDEENSPEQASPPADSPPADSSPVDSSPVDEVTPADDESADAAADDN